MFSKPYTDRAKFRNMLLSVQSEHCREADEAEANCVRRPSKFTETNWRRVIRAGEQANENWPPVLTRCEAAKMCRISVHTFDSWVRKGILPGPIIGTRRWSRSAIEQGLAGQVVALSANDQVSPFEQWKRGNAH
jgi:hypothetical protein